MRLFLLSLFVPFISMAQAQKPAPAQDSFITIVKANYSVKCPASWGIDSSSKMFGMDILFRSPKTDSLDDFYENMNVFVQDLHGANYDLARLAKESEEQIKNLVTDVVIMESRMDTGTSGQRYILSYKGRQGKLMLTTIQHYYLKNDIGYAVTMTLKQGNEQAYMEVADKILQSFRLHD